jgi:peptidylprolyl isomerase
VATDKRERQRAARLDKTVAQLSAAKRERARRTGIRIAVAAIVILAVLFGVSRLMADDSDPERADDDTATGTETTLPEDETTETTQPSYTDPAKAEEVLARGAPSTEPPPADTPKDAVQTTTLIEGVGTPVATGDLVTVHYVGKLADGTEFDQSWSRGEPFTVTVGAGEVIPGWDRGLEGAKIGERRHLVIGSDMAYGSQGQGPIPPDAPLAFDVDIVDIHSPS